MTQLPLQEAIPRFKINEENVDILVNGNTTSSYTTSNNEIVPSFLQFYSIQANAINTYVIAYTANVYADVIAAQTIAVAAATSAQTYAISANNSAISAANSANIAVDAMNQTLAVALNPADFATAAQGTKADTALQPGDVGSMAHQNANSVTITGGSISNTSINISVANFKMTGGNTTYKWLITDGSGNLSFSQPSISDLSDGANTINNLNSNMIVYAIALG